MSAPKRCSRAWQLAACRRPPVVYRRQRHKDQQRSGAEDEEHGRSSSQDAIQGIPPLVGQGRKQARGNGAEQHERNPKLDFIRYGPAGASWSGSGRACTFSWLLRPGSAAPPSHSHSGLRAAAASGVPSTCERKHPAYDA